MEKIKTQVIVDYDEFNKLIEETKYFNHLIASGDILMIESGRTYDDEKGYRNFKFFTQDEAFKEIAKEVEDLRTRLYNYIDKKNQLEDELEALKKKMWWKFW